MARVRSEGTGPERLVRSLLSARGIRYRLHHKGLPGKPDVYIGRLKIALFVNGCFWHGHDCPRGSRLPRANAEYWERKIMRNKQRDKATARQLHSMGIEVQILWTCQESTFASRCSLIAQRYTQAQGASARRRVHSKPRTPIGR